MTAACEAIGGELVAYLDGELDDRERSPVASHLSTCLACRRELERLTAVRRALAAVAPIEPSSDFAARFWERVEAESPPGGAHAPAPRPLRWVLPALAMAAVLALAFSSLVRPPAPPAPVAQAPAAVKPRVATAPTVEKEATQVADVDALRPEDLPPELLEHPELFLRLPVVRRLDTLEHFEAVHRESGDEGGAG